MSDTDAWPVAHAAGGPCGPIHRVCSGGELRPAPPRQPVLTRSPPRRQASLALPAEPLEEAPRPGDPVAGAQAGRRAAATGWRWNAGFGSGCSSSGAGGVLGWSPAGPAALGLPSSQGPVHTHRSSCEAPGPLWSPLLLREYRDPSPGLQVGSEQQACGGRAWGGGGHEGRRYRPPLESYAF